MAQLYGSNHDAASLAQRTGSMAAFGGVRLSTLEDAAGRGMRVLDFNTGSGLQFSVLVDRAMDISEVSHKGRAIGWHSPTGFRHPAHDDYEGEGGLGWTRSFSGFLATCGLDHVGGPQVVAAESYNYPRRSSVQHGLHGRISGTPARLTGYGEAWEGDRYILWAEGVCVQATMFGEVLHLHRRIEAELGGNTIHLSDKVVNAGFAPTPHMLMYHVNLGYPVVDEGARLVAPIRNVVWASHEGAGLAAQSVSYRTCPAPITGFAEQVWEHDLTADDSGNVTVAVVNDRLGFGLELQTRKEQLPCFYQWQNFQSGHYVMGIEPATHHAKGNQFARDRGEMIWLSAGEARHYVTRFRVLDGAAAIAASTARITAVQAQPNEDYPQPSGRFAALYGAKAGS
ncbi:MAG: aldose 1-epimerase family protein [Paracoccaceae bacterium]